MPAWPGGPCPSCGESMPENLVHCQTCRTLLNSDLETDSVELPAFVPLEEIATMIEVEPQGHYITCPTCSDELRIAGKYVGKNVRCNFCETPFEHQVPSSRLRAFYTQCPHCSEELRAAIKYLGLKVACKHCGGKIHCVTVRDDSTARAEV